VPDFPFFFTGFPETRFQIMPPVSVISALGGGYAVRVPVQGGSAGDPLFFCLLKMKTVSLLPDSL
jgi:hypothetical protein